jgi:hypothetical protein
MLEASPWIEAYGELRASRSKKEKETKATIGEKKSWKAKFVELEAKMAAMSATTTSGGAKAQVTPSFHAGGGFVPDDEDFGDFILSGMTLTMADMTLEAFAHTRSQTTAPKDAPWRTSPSLDLQHGEGNR